VRETMQRNINDILARRKHVFFGNVFEQPVPRESSPKTIGAAR
jgi:hypothetical protein